MEEAEALSSRIAIQVDGQIKCLGSVQHIKNKFGKGLELEIKVKIPSEDEINTILTNSKISTDKKADENDLD